MSLKINRDSLRFRARVQQLKIPPMLDLPGKPFRIMRREITAIQFGQFAKSAKYEIKGHKAEPHKACFRFPAIIKNPMEGGVPRNLVCLSLNDGRAYAEWLNKQTDRRFRVPTEAEWEVAKELVGKQLTGKWSGKNWEWTETKTTLLSCDVFVLRSFLFWDKREYSSNPEFRNHNFGVRLVEDII